MTTTIIKKDKYTKGLYHAKTINIDVQNFEEYEDYIEGEDYQVTSRASLNIDKEEGMIVNSNKHVEIEFKQCAHDMEFGDKVIIQ